MAKQALPAGLRLGSISTGTHRHADLIPKFLDLLQVLNPIRAAKIRSENHDIIECAYGESLESVDYTPEDLEVLAIDMNSMFEELWEAIDESMPKGYFFGTIEGDGSDYAVQEIPVELNTDAVIEQVKIDCPSREAQHEHGEAHGRS